MAVACCRCTRRCVLLQVVSDVVNIRIVDVNEFPAEFNSERFYFSVLRGIGNIAGQVNVSMSKRADDIILYVILPIYYDCCHVPPCDYLRGLLRALRR